MKNIKAAISLLLLISLFSTNSYSVKAHIDYTDFCNNKIENSLHTIIQSNSEETFPVIIWLNSSEITSNKTEIVENAYKNNNVTNIEQFNNLSDKEILEIIHLIKQENTKQIRNLTEKQNNSFKEELSSYGTVEYIDNYAPFAFMNLTKSQIQKISKNKNVQHIYYNKFQSKSLLGISRQVVRANQVQTNGVFGETGAGINVGIIDGGIPDISNNSLENININIESSSTNIVPHATYMAQVIAGQPCDSSATGIAPDVTLFCASAPAGSDRQITALNWMVKNNVDIVNISLDWSTVDSNENPIYNTYDGFCQILDYFSDKYMITFVVACGNAGTGGVSSPAMSYNAISVGNLNDNNTVTITDDSIHYSSSHINQQSLTNLPSKPDLCAPGTDICLDSRSRTGTSLAAPHVTGIAALLGEMEPLLLLSPSALKAVLVAGIKTDFSFVPSQRTITTNSDNPPESYIQCGAGLVDAAKSGIIVKTNHYDFSVMSTTKTEAIFSIECNANTKTRVALAFEKSMPEYSDGIWYNNYYDNLDLYVYDSSNNLVGASTTTNNNIEIVDFLTTSAGTYTIKIKRVATENQTDVRYAYAWN